MQRVRWPRLLREIGQHELGTVLSMSVLALGAWVFAEVLDEVQEGQTQGVDRMILLALREKADLNDPVGPRWLEEVGRDLTALGGFAVLGILTLVTVGYLSLLRKPRSALFVLTSVLGALGLSSLLKALIARPRPDLVPHHSYVLTMSFPSGHAMLSSAVYLTLGALLARFHTSFLLRAYILLWALLLSALVGCSRVYVGVHWPTDVIAGWAAGSAWAALCWIVARVLQRRGDVEPPTSSGPP